MGVDCVSMKWLAGLLCEEQGGQRVVNGGEGGLDNVVVVIPVESSW